VSERTRPRKPPLLAAITAIIQVRLMRELRRLRRTRSKKTRKRPRSTRPFFVLSLQLAADYLRSVRRDIGRRLATMERAENAARWIRRWSAMIGSREPRGIIPTDADRRLTQLLDREARALILVRSRLHDELSSALTIGRRVGARIVATGVASAGLCAHFRATWHYGTHEGCREIMAACTRARLWRESAAAAAAAVGQTRAP